LATEAARFSIQYGFDILRLEQIIGLVVPENAASTRVLDKCGLSFTGRAQYFGCELLRYAIKLVDLI
jgi:RimJ/RimL family protein N-acetyltransferase